MSWTHVSLPAHSVSGNCRIDFEEPTHRIDEKYFAYFFPHREASLAQGFLRFVAGARTPEFSDRKINPRLLLESQGTHGLARTPLSP